MSGTHLHNRAPNVGCTGTLPCPSLHSHNTSSILCKVPNSTIVKPSQTHVHTTRDDYKHCAQLSFWASRKTEISSPLRRHDALSASLRAEFCQFLSRSNSNARREGQIGSARGRRRGFSVHDRDQIFLMPAKSFTSTIMYSNLIPGFRLPAGFLPAFCATHAHLTPSFGRLDS